MNDQLILSFGPEINVVLASLGRTSDKDLRQEAYYAVTKFVNQYASSHDTIDRDAIKNHVFMAIKYHLLRVIRQRNLDIPTEDFVLDERENNLGEVDELLVNVRAVLKDKTLECFDLLIDGKCPAQICEIMGITRRQYQRYANTIKAAIKNQ